MSDKIQMINNILYRGNVMIIGERLAITCILVGSVGDLLGGFAVNVLCKVAC